MEKPRTISCETCTFWIKPPEGATDGECHRHAPLVTGGLHCAVETVFPLTKPENWCGDHFFNRAT